MGNFQHFLAYLVFGTMPGGLSSRSYTAVTTKDAESGRLRPPRRRLSLVLEQEQGANDIWIDAAGIQVATLLCNDRNSRRLRIKTGACVQQAAGDCLDVCLAVGKHV